VDPTPIRPHHVVTEQTQTPPAASKRRRLDPLSLAAITVVCLAVAIFATLVIVEVLGTSEEEAVGVEEALGPGDAPEAGSLDVGDPAPEVQMDLIGGGSVSTGDLRGTPAVVNFWSSTCAPCLAEMPDFESVSQELGGQVAFLGVDVVDTEEAGSKMVQRTGVTYPNGRDPRGETLSAFGGTALPRTVLLDAEGTVAAVHNGPMTAEELTAALEDAGLVA
jgi:cytochrome c biogenesis protein CcmG, thiol:disulfide interchange protein DsbE